MTIHYSAKQAGNSSNPISCPYPDVRSHDPIYSGVRGLWVVPGARNSVSGIQKSMDFWPVGPEVRWTSGGSPWTSVSSPMDFRKSKSPRNTPGIRPHARRNATGLFDSCPHRTFPVLQIYARGVSSSGCLSGETGTGAGVATRADLIRRKCQQG